jgi:stringent starvation protein B
MSTRAKRRGLSAVGSGDGPPPPHPLAQAIDQLYEVGSIPRLVIDARRNDVVVPDFVRSKWGIELVIDLDPNYPLELAYDEVGVHASLAFSGIVTRCTFAYRSIYRLMDRATGHGVAIPAHEPAAELPPELAFADAQPTTFVESKSRSKPPLAAVPSPTNATATATASTDDEAKARRAKFRLIDGG